MSRKKASRRRPSRPTWLRPRGLRVEWLEDRAVPTGLTVTLAEPAIQEGLLTIATVTRSGDLSGWLDVYLNSSDTTEAFFPGQVTILPGQASTSFAVKGVNDGIADGSHAVTILAKAAPPTGTISGTAKVIVLDAGASSLTAQPDEYDANEDDPWIEDWWPVLGNDTSPNGPLSASLASQPTHGWVDLYPDGRFVYTPEPNFWGVDSFTYRATDAAGQNSYAAVALYVWPMNDPILLTAPGPQATAEDTGVTFGTATGNAIRVTDVDDPRIQVSLLAGDGILTLSSTAGLEFPYPDSINNSPSITFYADNPAEANAALEGLAFTPGANFNGQTYLSVMVEDRTNPSYGGPPNYEFGNIPITVTAVNDAPTAAADAFEWYEDNPLTTYGMGVLGNDSDPEWDPLTAQLVGGPSHGTVSLNPNGTFTYTPAPNYNGPDSFTYRATDGILDSNAATVSLTIWPMDDAIQVAVPGPQSTVEDNTITFGSASGSAITVTDIENPPVAVSLYVSDGILTIQDTTGLEFPYPEDGNNVAFITFYADSPAAANAALEGLVFTPTADFNGKSMLNVLVRDRTSVSYQGEDWDYVEITVTAVNDAPVAVDDAYEWYEDETLTVYSSGIVSNDNDPEWDPLSAVLVNGPSHGTVTFQPGGGFTYTPDANYNGPDSFTYRATDGKLESNTATVSLTIWPMDDPIQVTVPGPQSVLEDGSLTFSTANGTAITITDIDGPRVYVELGVYGILTLASTDGLEFPYPEFTNNAPNIMFIADSPAEANAALEGLVYTPYPNETFSMGLSVYVRDESFPPYTYISDFDHTPITITPVNDAPVAVDDGLFSVEAGQPLHVQYGGWPGSGVLSNDADVDQDPLSVELFGGPSHGTATLNPDGTFTYTAVVTFAGIDTFTYRAFDGQLWSEPATVSILVHPLNLPPVSAADAYEMDEDGKLTVPAPGVLGNDSDPEGHSITAIRISGPSHGTLTLNPDGGFVYHPQANYHGPDGFWYWATDGAKFGEPTFVALTVNSVNEAPVAAGESYTLSEDGFWTVPAAGVLANDTDLDGDTLTAEVVSGPSHGTLTLNPNGGFTYTPVANYSGPDSFTYRAVDTAGAESVAAVTLTVQATNDPPVAADDAYTTNEELPFSQVVAGSTSLYMVSDPGEYIGQGLTYNLSPATGTFTARRNFDNGVTIEYRAAVGSQYFYLDFAAPFDATLMPGLYTGATRFAFHAPNVPGMDIHGSGRGSNTLTGWFRVDEVAYGPTGEVLVFNATFEQHSEGLPKALRGTIMFNAGATAAGGVLLNDTDSEGDPLTATLVEGPANGQLAFNPNGTFTYLPNPNFAGVDTFRYKVSDGSLDSQPATVTINVAGVNDAPVNVVPGTQSLMEDTTVTFSSANGNAIRLTDVDAVNTVIELRLTFNGFMTFPTTTGLTFVTGSNGGNIITVRGTLADLNNALEGMVARPGNNFVGQFYLTVNTNDLGNSGTGGAKSDSDLISHWITAVNDAPQNVVPLFPPTTAEDTPHSFSPNVWVTDVDQTTGAFSAPVRVTLDVVSGGGKLAVTPIAGVTVTGNNSDHIVLNGTISKINQSLAGLLFTPAADANNATTTAQIRVFTEDLANGGPGPLTDTDTFTVNVTPVNDTPLMNLSVGGVTVPMNGGASSFAGFASGAVGPATATDEHATQTLAFGVEVTGTTGNLTFASGPAIASDGTLTFTPAAGTWGTATVRVWASDGMAVTSDQTFSLAVTNTAPTTAGLTAVSMDEDAAPTAVGLAGAFADLEDGAAGLTFSVVGYSNPALFAEASVTGGVLTLTPTANASGSAAFTVRATDSGGLWVETSFDVTVAPVNDAPSFVGGSNVTVASNAGAQTVAGWAKSISNGPADESGQVLSFVVSAENQLLFTAQPAIDPATGALTFTPLSGASGMATVTVVLIDDGGTADGGRDATQAITFTITLTPPAATPGVQIIGTELIITGGTGKDTVTIDRINGGNGSNGVRVTGTVNGQSINKTYSQPFTSIRVGTGLGNDTVTISDTITLPSVIDGGAGTDSLKGGGGSDSIFGGDANDTINGAGGDDVVDAGAGNDSVNGGSGRDILFGGTGNDTLNGGDGNDLLMGGLGADQLFGQNNNDILVAGSAVVRNTATDSLRQVLNDWDPLVSGIYVGHRNRIAVNDDPASVDNLQGGSGTDWFWSFDPSDVLDMNGAEVRN